VTVLGRQLFVGDGVPKPVTVRACHAFMRACVCIHSWDIGFMQTEDSNNLQETCMM
jgi:hypothetical protein